MNAVKNSGRTGKKQLNTGKTLLAVRVVNWLQLAASLILVILYFSGYDYGTLLIVILLVPVTVVGNFIFSRSTENALREAEEKNALLELLRDEEELNRKLRAQRHDFRNHLQVLYSLTQLGEIDEALEYLKSVEKDLADMGAVLRTADPAVNALIAAKFGEAAARGIRMEIDTETSLEKNPMESWPFCRVLANLLDNAADAACGQEDAFVRLRLWEDEVGVHFSVRNRSTLLDARTREKLFEAGFTTKGERGTGMGLYIVRELLDSVGGKIVCDSSEHEVGMTGFVPWSKTDI